MQDHITKERELEAAKKKAADERAAAIKKVNLKDSMPVYREKLAAEKEEKKAQLTRRTSVIKKVNLEEKLQVVKDSEEAARQAIEERTNAQEAAVKKVDFEALREQAELEAPKRRESKTDYTRDELLEDGVLDLTARLSMLTAPVPEKPKETPKMMDIWI